MKLRYNGFSVLSDAELGFVIFSIKENLARARMKRNKAKSSGEVKAPLNKASSPNDGETNRSSDGAALSKEDLDGLSLNDLIRLEHQFNGYLGRVRAKKDKGIKIPTLTSGNSNTPEASVNLGSSLKPPEDTASSQGGHK